MDGQTGERTDRRSNEMGIMWFFVGTSGCYVTLFYVTSHIKRKSCHITTNLDGINLPSWELCDCKLHQYTDNSQITPISLARTDGGTDGRDYNSQFSNSYREIALYLQIIQMIKCLKIIY